MKNYQMLVEFDDGSQGHVTFDSNIMPENIRAETETARQAAYYHFPELKIKKVLAVSFEGIELTPETYVKVCDLVQALDREITHFTDGSKRDGMFKAIEALKELVKQHDVENISR